MKVESYVFFDGRCDEAIAFYEKALDAKVVMRMRFSEGPADGPRPQIPEGMEDKVMHAAFSVGDTTILASDGHCLGKANFDGFSLAISVSNDRDAEKYFSALTDGGQVLAPLMPSFFASRFGMVQDKFGVTWMVLTDHQ